MGPLILGLALALAGTPPTHPDRDALIRAALDHLHAERFAEALAAAETLKRTWPADPAGPLAAANVYQTIMRDYRVRVHEERFRDELDRARDLSDQAVESRPSPDAFFARGTARAYRAVHRFASGEWLAALVDALRGVADARRAAKLDPSFADPLLAVALHDFWKAEKGGLGLGLFGGGRRTVVARLERVRREARFVGVEAVYALQTVHLREGRLNDALQANDWLVGRYPRNPVGLYHRGLILERLGRPAEALGAWDLLVARLNEGPPPSDGFLAECHLHRHQALSLLAARGDQGAAAAAAEAARAARRHAGVRDARRELEGPFASFADIRRAIERLPVRSHGAVAGSAR